MTCYAVISFLQKYQLDPEQITVTVSGIASSINGTSACLEKGDQLSILQLLYGLMLESGNDAATALAESVGTLLYWEDTGNLQQIRSVKHIDRIVPKPPKLNTVSSYNSISNSSIMPKNEDREKDREKEKPPKLTFMDKITYFIKEMNKKARELKLTRTTYASVHGMSNRYNVSTASDVAQLSAIALKN